MPHLDYNLQSTWDAMYSVTDPLVGERHYTRDVRWQYIGADADILINALATKGLVQGQRIALIGAGFGWVGERLNELGYGPMANGTADGKICNVDTSTWIQANKAANSVTAVIDADVNSSTGRRIIRQQFGSNQAEVHWVITEDFLPNLLGPGPVPAGNNEIQPVCDACRQLASVGVAHWVTCRIGDGSAQMPNQNWKSLEEWKAWTSPDYVIGRNENGRIL